MCKNNGKTLPTHTQTHKGNRANCAPISQSKNREHERTQTEKETKQKLEAEKTIQMLLEKANRGKWHPEQTWPKEKLDKSKALETSLYHCQI